MKQDNPSFVLHGIQDVKFENRPIPQLVDDQVLVQVEKTGICGSDVHYLLHGKIGTFVLDKPMCLGHESSGVIVKLGPKADKVGKVKVGDRVALEPGQVCRVCEVCKVGLYELCPNMVFAATPPYTFGTLARYYALPADMCHPLPSTVSFEQGAMMEPLSVACHAVSTLGQCRSDQSVVVYGAGPVGLLSMAVAKALGARRVVAVDIAEKRLEFAKKTFATDTFLPPAKEPNELPDKYYARVTETIKSQLQIPYMGDGSIDLVIEASGADACVGMGLHILKPSGTFVQVGMSPSDTSAVPMFQIIAKQLRVLGSFRYGAHDYPLAISLVARGLIDLSELVTQRYEFEDAKKAFETTRAGKDPEGNPVIKCIISGPK
ncbi:hypothetical protein TREMEDRAFT_73604 [Tremella mesenterica DSM 1558]|uniref:uncharacterized protein n=1 Tax=Tremella mesenterica (strain ATCC 24925 / CBS 8224 / DSM 1558 / NBRC 9311 / NRRL Y-6157 / RJB 2259-6 / UBC 559-6) TaxID=578456 RepID=UPI0003F4A0F3|nr:uncharacterized protein TREMEDRAFT_73604 [Tremella mesenterica DSM 1558]EIW70927.1 hypothetical protein TREMEDRAFT_73604 [Tremella mesenterica DSM 1558]